MDMELKTRFIGSWNKYFGGAGFPSSFTTLIRKSAEKVAAPSAHMCMIGVLARVRKGASLCFEAGSIGCGGAGDIQGSPKK